MNPNNRGSSSDRSAGLTKLRRFFTTFFRCGTPAETLWNGIGRSYSQLDEC